MPTPVVVVICGDAIACNATFKYSEVIMVKSEETGREAEEPDDVACACVLYASYCMYAKMPFHFGHFMDT